LANYGKLIQDEEEAPADLRRKPINSERSADRAASRRAP
jgi:hypothetical protein